jgi:sterol desaturase/sphingolipid hydroxylase (fatty acid hydroxylase superfamily)
MLGAKGGNSAIAAGGLVGALGLGALYGPALHSQELRSVRASLLGPLAGGLVGFGLGQVWTRRLKHRRRWHWYRR